MSGFNGSGTFQISGVGLPYVSGTTISSATANTLNNDLATGLSNCITKDGQQVITADIGWNNHNINNLSSLGIGTVTPLGQLQVVNGATTNFIIDSSGNVGIGTSNPSFKLDVVGSMRGNATIELNNGTLAGVFGLNSFNTGVVGIGSTNNIAFVLGTDSSERMRIDSSGNVGIGTSSPTTKLEVVNAGYVSIKANNYTSTDDASFNARNIIAEGNFGVNATGQYMFTAQAVPTLFYNNGTERMRIDSSGNVGITTGTPCAKTHIYGPTQLTANLTDSGDRGCMIRLSGANSAAGSGGAVVFANIQGDNANSVGFAAIKGLLVDGSNNTSGELAFSTRVNSGDTSLTQQMIITTSGNVGIGTNNPGSFLLATEKNQNAQTSVTVTNTNSGTSGESTFIARNGTYIASFGVAGTGKSAFGCLTANDAYVYSDSNVSGSGVTLMAAAANGIIKFATGSSSERMRIDSSGNVGIGTTNNPSNFRLYTDANGISSVGSSNEEICMFAGAGDGFIGTWSNHKLHIGANGSNHITVTTAGNFGIGTTTASYKLQLSTDSAAKPSTNTWTIASDVRIKNVTGEYTKGLNAVCALRPITYEYNGAAGFKIDGKENISIIAQEAIQHFPECVGTFNAKLNETDETETELYNWNGHALTFALVNAVKELKAELDAVKTELSALKGL